MLRITIHHAAGSLTFQLEGTLVGPWVPELKDCWQSALVSQPAKAVRVDLTGVTFIDAPGKELLAAVHARGARFICADCLTKASWPRSMVEIPARPCRLGR